MRDLILDRNGKRLGHIDFEKSDDWCVGKIEFLDFPEGLRNLCQEYEGLVNDLVFSLLDELEQKIDEFGLRLASCEEQIYEFQLMNGDDIAFKLKTR